MSESYTLNINAATERQIKEHLKVGVSKARLLITKRNQQPGKYFTHESFISEIGRMEGASEWVQRGLLSFGPPHTPKGKKHKGLLENRGRPLRPYQRSQRGLRQYKCLHH